jgi:hypothetical protein
MIDIKTKSKEYYTVGTFPKTISYCSHFLVLKRLKNGQQEAVNRGRTDSEKNK